MNKKMVWAVVLVAMLVIGSLVALFVFTTLDNGRIAYISVKTGKSSYDAGENVTFQLIDNTPDIEFNVTDQNDTPGHITYSMGSINIVKIPDGIDPGWVSKNLLANDNLASDPFRADTPVASVHYGYFSNEHTPLDLSWDGKICSYNTFTDGSTYFPATSGYYLVLPDFRYAASHQIIFKIDQNAIFHYGGLGAGIYMTMNPNHNVTVTLRLATPPGTSGNLTADLFSNLRYPEISGQTVGGHVIIVSDHYHNETIMLDSTADTIRTIVFDVKVPDDGNTSQTVFFEALLVTPAGNFTFGYSGNWWNGGWMGMGQY